MEFERFGLDGFSRRSPNLTYSYSSSIVSTLTVQWTFLNLHINSNTPVFVELRFVQQTVICSTYSVILLNKLTYVVLFNKLTY